MNESGNHDSDSPTSQDISHNIRRIASRLKSAEIEIKY